MRKVIFIALSLLSICGYGQGVKISALPQAGSLSGSELTAVVQSGVTKKTTLQSIANLGGGVIDSNGFWKIHGNTGTGGTAILGTTDGAPFRVSTSSFWYYTDNAIFLCGSNPYTGDSAILMRGKRIDMNGDFVNITPTNCNIEVDNVISLISRQLTLNDSLLNYSSRWFINTYGDSIRYSIFTDNQGNLGFVEDNNHKWSAGYYLLNKNENNPKVQMFYGILDSNNIVSDTHRIQIDSGGLSIFDIRFPPKNGYVLTHDSTGYENWRPIALSDTATLDFGSITANNQQILTVTVTGAALSDVVSLGIPQATMNTNKIGFNAWVSATNTVSVKCFNFDGGSIDPASGLFTVKVFK